jgi:hypothetical protein
MHWILRVRSLRRPPDTCAIDCRLHQNTRVASKPRSHLVAHMGSLRFGPHDPHPLAKQCILERTKEKLDALPVKRYERARLLRKLRDLIRSEGMRLARAFLARQRARQKYEDARSTAPDLHRLENMLGGLEELVLLTRFKECKQAWFSYRERQRKASPEHASPARVGDSRSRGVRPGALEAQAELARSGFRGAHAGGGGVGAARKGSPRAPGLTPEAEGRGEKSHTSDRADEGMRWIRRPATKPSSIATHFRGP